MRCAERNAPAWALPDRFACPGKLEVSNKVWATGEYLADDRQAEDSLRLSCERLWRDKIDLMLCHSLVKFFLKAAGV